MRKGYNFTRKVGDKVARGERVGLIKFGSRVDVLLPASAEVKVKVGDHVAGGGSLLGSYQRRVVAAWPEQVTGGR